MPAVLGKLYGGNCPSLLLAVAGGVGLYMIWDGKAALKMKVRSDAGSVTAGMAAIGLLRGACDRPGSDIERPATGLGKLRSLRRPPGHRLID